MASKTDKKSIAHEFLSSSQDILDDSNKYKLIEKLLDEEIESAKNDLEIYINKTGYRNNVESKPTKTGRFNITENGNPNPTASIRNLGSQARVITEMRNNLVSLITHKLTIVEKSTKAKTAIIKLMSDLKIKHEGDGDSNAESFAVNLYQQVISGEKYDDSKDVPSGEPNIDKIVENIDGDTDSKDNPKNITKKKTPKPISGKSNKSSKKKKVLKLTKNVILGYDESTKKIIPFNSKTHEVVKVPHVTKYKVTKVDDKYIIKSVDYILTVVNSN